MFKLRTELESSEPVKWKAVALPASLTALRYTRCKLHPSIHKTPLLPVYFVISDEKKKKEALKHGLTRVSKNVDVKGTGFLIQHLLKR